MLAFISYRCFQFIIRIVTGAVLAVLLLFAGKSYANSADYEPGGRYDYSDTGYAPYSRGSDYDNSGRDSEQRDRDRVESNRQSYVDQERRRTESDRQAQEYRRESMRQYQDAESARRTR